MDAHSFKECMERSQHKKFVPFGETVMARHLSTTFEQKGTQIQCMVFGLE